MGIYSTILSLNAFFGIIVGLSAHGAVESNFYQLSKANIALYVGNVMIVLTLTFTMCVVFVFLFSDLIYQTFEINYQWQLISLFIVLFQFITLINSTIWVMNGKSVRYGLFQVFISLATLLLSCLFIIGLNFDWRGQIYSLLISSFMSATLAVYYLVSSNYLKIKLNLYFLNDFVRFGIPMIPHQLSNWIKGQGDRLLLISMLGSSSAGLYSVGFQIGSIMGLLLMSANRAFYPYVFKKLSLGMTETMRIQHVKLTYKLMLLILFLGTFFILLLEFTFKFVIGNDFLDSLIIAQLVVLAFIFDGFYYLFVCVLFYFKETVMLAKITFPLSIFHIFISYYLIQSYSEMGVAYALIITYFLQFVLVWFYSNRVHRMPWLLRD